MTPIDKISLTNKIIIGIFCIGACLGFGMEGQIGFMFAFLCLLNLITSIFKEY